MCTLPVVLLILRLTFFRIKVNLLNLKELAMVFGEQVLSNLWFYRHSRIHQFVSLLQSLIPLLFPTNYIALAGRVMGQLFALGLQELDKTISTHCLIISEVAEDTENIVFLPSYYQIVRFLQSSVLPLILLSDILGPYKGGHQKLLSGFFLLRP